MDKTNFREYFQAGLATFTVVTIIAYFFLITFTDGAVLDSIKNVVPIFTSLLSLLVGYYFGSSSGAKTKDETITALSNQPKP